MSYVLQLNDGQTLEYPVKDVDFYPTIKGNIEYLAIDPGDTIILNYSDPEYLYKIFTTNYLKTNYNLDDFVRIANAVDFLGNDDILKQLMASLVTWFTDPVLLNQFKANKTNVEDAMFNLNAGPMYWLLRNPTRDYDLDIEITTVQYDLAVSDNLEYVVVYGWNREPVAPHAFIPQILGQMVHSVLKFIAIYRNGQLIHNITNLTNTEKPRSMIIDNNGILYSVINKDIYKWLPPHYNMELYKNVKGWSEYIKLSNNAQRYMVKKDDQYSVVDSITESVISVAPSYFPPQPNNMPVGMYQFQLQLPLPAPAVAKPAPHMNLLFVEYNKQVNMKNHSVWIVSKNTTSWIDIPYSEKLLISHDENIIAAYGLQDDDEYGIYLYQIGSGLGLNFIPLSNTQNVREPLAVSKNVLLTIDKGNIADIADIVKRTQGVSPMAMSPLTIEEPVDIVVNIYNIKGQNIRDKPANQITFPSKRRQLLEAVFSGPEDSYLFFIIPDVERVKNQSIKLVKYSIKGYERLNDFLVAKLG